MVAALVSASLLTKAWHSTILQDASIHDSINNEHVQTKHMSYPLLFVTTSAANVRLGEISIALCFGVEKDICLKPCAHGLRQNIQVFRVFCLL